ncbi:hypothetical protein FTO74_14290 [Granulicella sp. WH15]|uniref:hypothetical protein n=1 Tax=Granulicella sp. WH15 TaxID=2602070 RepID=UPI001366DA0F|nr:hypothetical protein [Granulicella sp. WH15]QHN04401.1 hypothetical protein FTO74_14290 [Granulicella sp. WH15]
MTTSSPIILRHTEAGILRTQLKEAMQRSPLSRAQIVEKLAEATGDQVTERRLNGYLAESKEDYKFPAELILSICEILGDHSVLLKMVERAGFRMIGPEEERLLTIGAAYEAKVRAEKVLAEVAL